jgi:hypothetical protein
MLCVSKNHIEFWMSGDGALVCGLAPGGRPGPKLSQAVVCVCVWCVCVCVCVCGVVRCASPLIALASSSHRARTCSYLQASNSN